jgi:quinol-cytochrome oxidoreductase complex cytochrome b subunit
MTFYLIYALLMLIIVAVSGIILALAYKLSPSQWKQSINNFFNLEGTE